MMWDLGVTSTPASRRLRRDAGRPNSHRGASWSSELALYCCDEVSLMYRLLFGDEDADNAGDGRLHIL